MKREENGITLVALIITIIILLILAVVSIMAVTGTGLFAKTSDAVDKYENSREKENFVLENHAETIGNYILGGKGSSVESGNTGGGNTDTGKLYLFTGGSAAIYLKDGKCTMYSGGTNAGECNYTQNGQIFSFETGTGAFSSSSISDLTASSDFSTLTSGETVLTLSDMTLEEYLAS